MYINIIIIIDDSNDMREGGASVSVRGRGAKRGGASVRGIRGAKRGGASVTMREGETYNSKAFIYKFVINLDDSIVTTFERTSVNTRTIRGRGATRGGASAMTRGGAHSIDGTINTCLFM